MPRPASQPDGATVSRMRILSDRPTKARRVDAPDQGEPTNVITIDHGDPVQYWRCYRCRAWASDAAGSDGRRRWLCEVCIREEITEEVEQ